MNNLQQITNYLDYYNIAYHLHFNPNIRLYNLVLIHDERTTISFPEYTAKSEEGRENVLKEVMRILDK